MNRVFAYSPLQTSFRRTLCSDAQTRHIFVWEVFAYPALCTRNSKKIPFLQYIHILLLLFI